MAGDYRLVHRAPYFILVRIGRAYGARGCINIPITRVAYCVPPDGPDGDGGLPLEHAA